MLASAFLSIFAFVAASTAAPWSDPTVCKPGTGYYQSCESTGFEGCCTKDVCGMKLSYCPDITATPPPTHTNHKWIPDVRNPEPTPEHAPGSCNAGLSYYVCANGFKGCCAQDACTVGYCPSNNADNNGAWVDTHEHHEEKPASPSAGYYQVCANGFKGYCTKDACTLGYCPDNGAFQKVKRDANVCAPGTGYYQVCGATGFRGCCAEDVCGKKLSYCPASTPAPVPAQKKPSTHAYPVQPVDGVCPAGTGYYQVCSNGFKGCCAVDACGLGYCPY